MQHPKPESGNIAEIFVRMARTYPDLEALSCPVSWDDESLEVRFETVTYRELLERAAAYQRGLFADGFKPGDRVIVLFPICVDLYCFLLALLASKMVPVLIDTGMGLSRIRSSVRDSGARAMVSIGKLLRIRFLLPAPRPFRWYAADGYRCFGVKPLASLARRGGELEVAKAHEDDHGLITFTSGSTGRPKGADRTHGMMLNQHLRLREAVPDHPGDIEMTSFPVFVLHALACGMPSVMAPVDFGAPGSVNPGLVVRQVRERGITRIAGAAAFFQRIVDYAIERGITLPGVRDLGTGGAPVPPALCEKLRTVFPGAKIKVVYGSTEAEPMSSVSVEDLLAARGNGRGYLVGAPYHFVQLAAVRLPDDPGMITDTTMDAYRVPAGEVGEIVVKGEHVLKGYIDNPEATRENKIPCPDGMVWHRTGDTGYFDERGRLWLTGRMRDVVPVGGRLVDPFPVELAIDAVPGVRRSAFILSGKGREPLLVVEPAAARDAIVPGLRAALREFGIENTAIRWVKKMPVDGRHNSKIDRVTLRNRFA